MIVKCAWLLAKLAIVQMVVAAIWLAWKVCA